MLCEKYRFDLANLASVPTSLVTLEVFLPFLNLLRDNSDVHCSNKATEGAFFTSMMRIRIEDLMKRRHYIFPYVAY